MELNQAARRVLGAFLEKWKAEEQSQQAEDRLRLALSQPTPAPFKRRF